MKRSLPSHSLDRAFTLVELMVSTAIIAMIVIILVSITGATSNTWRMTNAKVEQFRETRAAFETLTTRLAQATLNTYWDYDNPAQPTRYERRSELRFISGPASNAQPPLLGASATGAQRVTHATFFHAPLGFVDDSQSGTTNPYHGLENLLNVWGYYVEFGDDTDLRPSFLGNASPKIPSRFRFRMMEFMQPSEQLRTYKYTSGPTPLAAGGKPNASSYGGLEWFQEGLQTVSKPHMLAENVVALILLPMLSKQDQADFNLKSTDLAPHYLYDSSGKNVDAVTKQNPNTNPTSQLPPVVQVTMVAIDEQSAVRLRLKDSSVDIFNVKSKFTDATKLAADLNLDPTNSSTDNLESTLISMHVNYRIFTTDVPLRAAKWSREQTDK